MKAVFIAILVSLSCFAQKYNENGKIDMHGGKYNSLYSSKSRSFGKSGMGMSIFSDTNTSKKTPPSKPKEKTKPSPLQD